MTPPWTAVTVRGRTVYLDPLDSMPWLASILARLAREDAQAGVTEADLFLGYRWNTSMANTIGLNHGEVQTTQADDR